MSLLSKIFGDPNARVVARLKPEVDEIAALEAEVTRLRGIGEKESNPNRPRPAYQMDTYWLRGQGV